MSPRANDRGDTRAAMDDEAASVSARDAADERGDARLARSSEPSTSTRRADARREPLVETFGRLARTSRAAVAHHPRVRAIRRVVGRHGVDDLPPNATLVMFGAVYCERGEEEEGEGRDAYERGKAAWMRDWRSRCWMTYRRGFEALGTSEWRTDAGWGCTLRSAQMMVANALSVHSRGRHWRRELESSDRGDEAATGDDDDGDDDEAPRFSFLSDMVNKLRIPENRRTKRGCDAQEDILRWFADDERAPFSIHRVCEKTSEWGIPPGRWFEPSVMCRAFEELVVGDEALGASLAVHVVRASKDHDGGVPMLDERVLRAKSVDVDKALLLFVPLVLGVGRTINARYLSQLQSILSFKQSVGILGGRPNASLYLVGYSDDVFFYLDPHVVQPASSYDDRTMDIESYYCSTPLHVRGENLDPTLALGFYCRNWDDIDDLLARVRALSEANVAAPILLVRTPTEPIEEQIVRRVPERDDEFSDWEFV